MKSTAALLMFITVLSKIIGLFRDKMMAYYFGTGPIARAIVTSSTIPLVLFGMIASGIATGYIPRRSWRPATRGSKRKPFGAVG